MSGHIKLTIDGEVRIDGNLGEWNNNPPPFVTDTLKAATGAKPQPWMRTALQPIAEAASRATAAKAGIKLPPLNGTYTVHVEHRNGDTNITINTTD